MSCPSDQVMVPQVPSPVFLLPMQKAGGGQQILHSALINDLFPPLLPLRRAISGKGDWTWQGSETRRIRDQEKAVPLCHYWLLPALLGSSAPTLQGRLGYKDPRAKCFLREKKKGKEKAVPFCRTQGCPANMEFPLLCYRTKWKWQECRPCLPNGKKLLQTVSLQYVQSTL